MKILLDKRFLLEFFSYSFFIFFLASCSIGIGVMSYTAHFVYSGLLLLEYL